MFLQEERIYKKRVARCATALPRRKAKTINTILEERDPDEEVCIFQFHFLFYFDTNLSVQRRCTKCIDETSSILLSHFNKSPHDIIIAVCVYSKAESPLTTHHNVITNKQAMFSEI